MKYSWRSPVRDEVLHVQFGKIGKCADEKATKKMGEHTPKYFSIFGSVSISSNGKIIVAVHLLNCEFKLALLN